VYVLEQQAIELFGDNLFIGSFFTMFLGWPLGHLGLSVCGFEIVGNQGFF
jgi:hypothetical protein